ncbi:MAG: hypothetical protein AAFX87_00445 [Bacteroidota bacterium]
MKNLLIILCCLGASTLCFGQEEEVTYENTEEEVDTGTEDKLLNTYNYIIRAQVEETQLFKVDLLYPFSYALSGPENDTTLTGLFRLTYERKFKPEWSWLVHTGWQGNRGTGEIRDVLFRGGVRYYYNLDKRILKGKSANNFSANYVSIDPVYQVRPQDDDTSVSVLLLYGLQRRLGKYGYLDLNFGFQGNIKSYPDVNDSIEVIVEFEIGIAF